MKEDLLLAFKRFLRRVRSCFPRASLKKKPVRHFVEPLIGETWGEYEDYCFAVRGKSKYDWAPSNYVFNGAAFFRKRR